MHIETKDFALQQFELKEDGDVMTVEGYGSTFGGEPDSYGDIIAKGAFEKSLRVRKPKMLYQHDSHRICGIWDKADEDDKGLYLKGRFINTTLGRDVHQEALSTALDSMSIGFRTRKASYNEADSIRTLEQVDLFEVSLVTFPANENALVTGVKAALTPRAIEKILRDAGFSREQAKAFLADGYKGIDPQRDAGGKEASEVLALFQSITSNPQ